jgi:hypothetical protein
MSQERLGSTPESPRPELKGIDRALNEGNRLHGFRSGGGLRVIRLEQEGKLTGYGEHPSADEALKHTDEDFLAGGRDYHEVYGKLNPHYLTGSHEVTSPLDGWLLQGHTVDAHRTDEGNVRVELTGLTETRQPQAVLDQAKALRRPIVWMERGFTYETTYDPHLFPNGDEGHSTKVLDVPEGKDQHRAWMYYRTKTGEGKAFNEALDKAFEAPDREIEDPHR